MRIFGGLLPFIGYRREWVPASLVDDCLDVRACARRRMEGGELVIQLDVLQVEWFWVGLMLTARPVQ